MKVLHVTSAFYPATYWGGPIFSTYALCNGIAVHRDVTLRVLTTDSAGPRVTDRVAVSNWPEIVPPGYEVYFTRRLLGRDIAPGLFSRLLAMTRWADVVHLTGNYTGPCLPTMMACRLTGRPLVWSPRGSLQATEEWSGVRRRGPKNVFDRAVRACLPKRTVMHVTAEMERALSQKRIPGPPAVVIPNGVDAPTRLPDRPWRPEGRLRLMFISRLDPKKGLENLFTAMASLPETISLDVYGSGEAGYSESLKKLPANLGIADRVIFHGHVDGQAKTAAFSSADLLVLPSYSENFGMVVAEAMAYGIPVITSHATPWQRVEAMGCGRWIDNAPEAVAQAIRDMSVQDLAEMGRRGHEWAVSELGWQALSNRMVDLYRGLVDGRPSIEETHAQTQLQSQP